MDHTTDPMDRPTCAACGARFLSYTKLEAHHYHAHIRPAWTMVDDRPEWVRRAQDGRLAAKVLA